MCKFLVHLEFILCMVWGIALFFFFSKGLSNYSRIIFKKPFCPNDPSLFLDFLLIFACPASSCAYPTLFWLKDFVALLLCRNGVRWCAGKLALQKRWGKSPHSTC
jgi:hypothetical protein